MVDKSKQLKEFVRNWMNENGYKFVHQNRFIAARALGQRIFCEELVLSQKSIYETSLKPDFALYQPQKEAFLLIECIWQEASGTTDQKFPYKVLNIKERFPAESMAVILIDGGGYEAGALGWLEAQRDGKLVDVVDKVRFRAAMKEHKFE